MKTLSSLIIFCFALVGYAQQAKVEVSSKRNSDKSVTFSYSKTELGSYTIVLKFSSLENASFGKGEFTIKGKSGNLFKLRPIDPEKSISYRYSFRYYPGELNPKIKKGITYILPVDTTTTARVNELDYLWSKYQDREEPENWKAFMIQSDTPKNIRAMRRGVVIKIDGQHQYDTRVRKSYTSNSNIILVEHPDGTIARYGGFDQKQIAVKLGQKVYPYTLLGKTGEYNKGEYRINFMIYYLSKLESKNGSIWAYINPYFQTQSGRMQLENRTVYKNQMSAELFQQEFSKREKKRLKKYPEKFGLPK